ncbi:MULTISPECIES: hypothetical protein [unclassified Rhizobium]|uniref:hypothetical protein n=1 Tax=unclassified Rhizobium TaxID=2613769 RepID=UPI0028893BE9|nr:MULTISPECIES: hypothetical protein [unclassified Rhizobium]
MSTTANLNLPLPDPSANVDDEFYRLQQTMELLDALIFALQTAVAGKAAVSHTHTQAQVTGLVTALANKMDANKTFKLIDLVDVLGVSDAAAGYLLQKTTTGFGFASAAAVIGNHQHTTADIVGLTALIQQNIAALVNSSPATLDTLSELAAAIGNNPNFATTMTNALAAKLATAGGTMTGPLGLHSTWGTNAIQNGTGDNANYTTFNFALRGWYGMGMVSHSDGSVMGYYDFRGGWWDVKGGFKVNGNAVPHAGNKATAAEITSGAANKFPDAVAVRDAIAANAPQLFSGAYTQVALARATPRQNTTGKPLFVSIVHVGSSGWAPDIILQAGSPGGGYNTIAKNNGSSTGSGYSATCSGIISPGEYYQYNNTAGLGFTGYTVWEKS